MIGAIVSLNLVAWISFGTQAAISKGEIVFPVKAVSVEGCSDTLKKTVGNITHIIGQAVRYNNNKIEAQEKTQRSVLLFVTFDGFSEKSRSFCTESLIYGTLGLGF